MRCAWLDCDAVAVADCDCCGVPFCDRHGTVDPIDGFACCEECAHDPTRHVSWPQEYDPTLERRRTR